ncbi:hypothetical protein [Pseudactinotalea sp. Z1732]|uniref:hypothetical protein n=1 Tax=Pseudactinotalea sp. Z1732 TaxID=3413026 RepID=UPI003C7A20EB
MVAAPRPRAVPRPVLPTGVRTVDPVVPAGAGRPVDPARAAVTEDLRRAAPPGGAHRAAQVDGADSSSAAPAVVLRERACRTGGRDLTEPDGTNRTGDAARASPGRVDNEERAHPLWMDPAGGGDQSLSGAVGAAGAGGAGQRRKGADDGGSVP